MDQVEAFRERLKGLKTTSSLCPVERLLSELDEETADILRDIIAGPTPTARIHAEIRAAGLSLDRGSLSYHRKGICRCANGDTE